MSSMCSLFIDPCAMEQLNMKVTTNNAAGSQQDPNKGDNPGSTVGGSGKVTVQPQEGAKEGPGGAPERPKWLPEGFDSPEALAAAYAKLAAPKKAADDKATEQKVEAA